MLEHWNLGGEFNNIFMYNDSVLCLFRIVNRETTQRLFHAYTDQFENSYSFKTKLLRHKDKPFTT